MEEKIKSILKKVAEEKKFITIGRLFRELKIGNSRLETKKINLLLTIINDEFYKKKKIIISSLILKDNKYYPIDLFLDYSFSKNLIKNDSAENLTIFWEKEAQKCFAYYDKFDIIS